MIERLIEAVLSGPIPYRSYSLFTFIVLVGWIIWTVRFIRRPETLLSQVSASAESAIQDTQISAGRDVNINQTTYVTLPPNRGSVEKRFEKGETLTQLFRDLRDQLSLLHEYVEKSKSEPKFLSEIAAKLYVLVGGEEPLLLSLMDYYGYGTKPVITVGGPPGVVATSQGRSFPPQRIYTGKKITLRQYLDLDAFGIQTSTGFRRMTKSEFIEVVVFQAGGAQKGSKLDERYANVRDSGILIGGTSAALLELRTTAETVLRAGQEFLDRTPNSG